MTAVPSFKDAFPLSSSSPADHRSQPQEWPLVGSAKPAALVVSGVDNGGAVARQQAADSEMAAGEFTSSSSAEKQQLPWWKTRRAKLGFAVGALLLVAFVVLLTLGLLGYLRKVGPFGNLLNKDSIFSQPPANPLSTIPLMSDPFANPPAAADSSPTPSSIALAGLATPTTQPMPMPIINGVRRSCCRCCLLFAFCSLQGRRLYPILTFVTAVT